MAATVAFFEFKSSAIVYCWDEGSNEFLMKEELALLLWAGLKKAAKYFLLAVFVFTAEFLPAIPLKYSLKAGSTYTFEIQTKVLSEIETFGFKKAEPLETKSNVSVEVLMYQGGIWILNIKEGNRRVRRYFRGDGSIVLTPDENSSILPFFLTFPVEELKAGKPFEKKATISVGNREIPLVWTIKALGSQPSATKFPVTISCVSALPSDRAVQRKLELHGTFTMDTELGCPSEGDWAVNYSLLFANKELAIIRPIWAYRYSRKISFKLLEAKEGISK